MQTFIKNKNSGVIMENDLKLPQKLKIQLQYDLTISLLDLYTKEMKQSTKDICTLVFAVKLFTKVKKQKQLK